ncbi:N-acetylmuramoyl-L-alanine amidase [Nonomuraea purpurea]|uniref:N-acetylmuramoyl-L-alanine amidase n=1 Tax=Nonomuraea purpurea TaxID=1849276 RepID=A0ABV8GI29_9ACTN
MQLRLAAAVLTAGALIAPSDVHASGFQNAHTGTLTAGTSAAGRRVGVPAVSWRQADFAAAAREYGVPLSVLLGVAYLESRWDANGGLPSTAGGYGPMHLVDVAPAEALTIGDAIGDARGDDSRPMAATLTTSVPSAAMRLTQPQTTLPEAARLTGLPADRLRNDPTANIRAGAALLASYQERPSADPADWYESIARYSGAQDQSAAHAFADEVFSVIREGVTRRTDDGHVVQLTPAPGLTTPGTTAAGERNKAEEAEAQFGTRPDPDDLAGTSAATEVRAGAGAMTKNRLNADPGVEALGQAGAESWTVPGPRTKVRTRAKARARTGSGAKGQAGSGPGPDSWAESGSENDGWADFGAENGPDIPLEGEFEADWEADAMGQPYGSPLPRASGQTSGQTECPSSLACEWMPAAHKRFGKKKDRDYGNHDRMLRPRAVDYIVIHDTEGGYQGIPSMIRNPRYVSWHYTIRSRDGHVAQHVPTGSIAWHAGNWDVNTRSIGIEHEGYLAKGGTWYTEAMYRSSARLVRFLAAKYHIPLNRAHILGHDNVPGTTAKMVAGMHEDPGPYWDWAHYFALMGKPLKAAKDGGSIMIRPSYDTNRPRFTGCVTTKPGRPCPEHGAATVWLHKEPSESSPLITDAGKHPGKPSTHSVYDHSARASTGQRYAVAARQDDWTAIWYLGQKAWFHNPPSAPTAVPAKGPMVTPLKANTVVYGRAYPEQSAYKSASYQPLTPLQYKISPGQTYTVGDTITGSFYSANAFHPSKHVTTTGTVRYHQIQLGHRVMFVMAKDVRMVR